ncbi:unnamed protein product [Peniophora sp. CBMAI 1063]|nr:unnamed protein product [Peniophora sp. CBMAI 1063]
MSPDILDPSALLQSLPSLLPENKQLGSQYDAIAVLLHTAMIALGFRLIAVDDSSSATSYDNNVLPSQWNSHAPNYTFRYRHEQSSLEFVLKLAKLGKRTIINAIAVESEKVATLDISTDDFTSPSFFPYSQETTAPLVHGFISSNRVTDLISQFKLKIVQALIPGLNKLGYAEEPAQPSSSNRQQQQQRPPAAQPRPVSPPFNPGQPPSIPQPLPGNPLEIGRRDRDPMGGYVNPFAPPPMFPGAGGDGMFVGPNHPIFGNRGPGGVGGVPMPGRGPWGGDGFLPPMGAPPGARFDPVGPFGSTSPFPRGGLPRGAQAGEPDNDEFLPPGNNHDDMYM